MTQVNQKNQMKVEADAALSNPQFLMFWQKVVAGCTAAGFDFGGYFAKPEFIISVNDKWLESYSVDDAVMEITIA